MYILWLSLSLSIFITVTEADGEQMNETMTWFYFHQKLYRCSFIVRPFHRIRIICWMLPGYVVGDNGRGPTNQASYSRNLTPRLFPLFEELEISLAAPCERL